MTEEKIQVLNTMVHHRLMVQDALLRVIQNLERRSLVHDASKFQEDEFAGFARINRVARVHPYGSDEYRASLKAEKPVIELHYSRNSHHPEAHQEPGEMGLLDLIEMACDWHAAWKVYDGQRPADQRSTWMENIEKQRKRFLEPGTLSKEQWFVVEEMAFVLEFGD